MSGLINKKALLPVLLLTLIFVGPEIAYAAEPGIDQVTNETLGFMIATVIKTLNALLWPLLLIIGDLMDNDLIVGPEMEDRLLSIWVEIRNLVNIGFVLVLLVIAFYNALPFTESEGNLAIKTALPKLIIGLILVNFTYVGAKVVLDVANIGTTAAFALPEIVEDFDFSEQKEEFTTEVCQNNSDDGEWTVWTKADDEAGKTPINAQIFCAYNKETETYVNEDGKPDLTGYMAATYFQDLNKSNISIIMAVNAGALESLSLLNPDAVTDISDLVANSLFSLIMYLVFAVTYIVLGIVLITRIAVMWIAIAFSPVAVLFFVVPQLKDALGSGGGDIVGKITKNLLAPIIIGLSMTVGYLMISALGDVGEISTEFSNFKADALLDKEFFSSGIHDMEKLIIAIASIVIVWLGVFAAAEGTIAETVTGGIKDLAAKAGKAAATAPLFAPVLPVVSKDGTSVSASPLALFGLAKQEINRFDSGYYADQQVDKFRRSVGLSGGGGGAGASPEVNAQHIDDTLRQLDNPKEISQSQAADIARRLYHTVDANTSIDEGRRKQITTAIQNAQKQIEAGEGISQLQYVFRSGEYSAEELNISGNQHSRFEDRLSQITTVTDGGTAATTEPAATTNPPTSTVQNINVGTLTALPEATRTKLSEHVDEVPQGATEEQVRAVRTKTNTTLGDEMEPDEITQIVSAVAPQPAAAAPTETEDEADEGADTPPPPE